LLLSENIRKFRKQRGMTQEKLAEALGVTVGAVYKWESGLSQPELSMLVDIADFFDTSVDVLLGCRMKDNRLDASLERMSDLCRTLDDEAVNEAEKVLGRYPHSFKAVYSCGLVFMCYGLSFHRRDLLEKARELMNQALVLLPQNDDPSVSDAVINGNLAVICFLLDEREKSIELLKRHNSQGVYNGWIGFLLAAYMNRHAEAAPYLSEAIVHDILDLLDVIAGYFFVYQNNRDWEKALAISQWGLDIIDSLTEKDALDFLRKSHAKLQVLKSYCLNRLGNNDESLQLLKKAAEVCLEFDNAPDYTLKTMRFNELGEQNSVYDILGSTARESTTNLVDLLDDQPFAQLWKEVSENE
ncbi:MAG: helix-turn-helix domain-containing protein, partial [Erysipelotrichaceae bacterium]|nr:helix-turn-helix domain-containing protein [Erysipelotrichaceae bacterium]